MKLVAGLTRQTSGEVLFEGHPIDAKAKARIAYITLDEKTGTEKRTTQTSLVQANDLHRALTRLDECMKGTLGEWVIVSIAETAIIDVYKFKAEDDEPAGKNKKD